MKENINEHDKTKQMMEIMRGGFKKLIKEEEMPAPSSLPPQGVQGDDSPEPTKSEDTLTPVAGDAVFNDELKKLQDTVDPDVLITNFKIYPTDRNIIIEGVFQQGESENSGIQFKMSFKAKEIETTMNNVDLNDDTSGLLQRLKGYYQNWIKEWAIKLNNEYRPKQD